ncbi:hypothetical protein Ae406Ps2_3922c [Pseudonocardia sp. Ae406_Ps2]|uniref:hypothetical protein n=1 Tax=unclassified Pseudonocardia TaxID=2619320 RepID=UPI00094B09BC|nr:MULTISPECIES: hypothetical protein [unclassified Pseudonocardia]KAA1010698.1 hypothetical protein FVA95_28320 [Pseudonocardia sp. EV170527-09]OLL98359.1 hypothetical protein Ae331Ps2_2026 [Pseudonocardia sp. Ae331_Ps2]OLM03922.1 hypothetical protein Ae406Ps2_3922c [Pseudonocardia sp. Ae406_Ps2]OLM11239.1 hypothetical protein Ae505Ps2_1362 [Pseudonocardia sp. Ae505_Ps2]OLM25477.1 hypothetical protein Ae706Ps2_3910c [Pseudonocardia sp. Ae706_Ps2]
MAAHDISLIDFIKLLLGSGSESIQVRDWFNDNPNAVLQHYGLADLSPEDVRDALVIAQDNDTVSFDRHYDTGFNWGGDKGGWSEGKGDHGHKAAASHENVHVKDVWHTENIDDRDTIVDNSVNQHINTHGGDFDQDIDIRSTTASGDGAVAAGGDIDGSTITTGNGNVVGDGNNVVKGDGNTSAFGSGSATKTGDISADKGGAVSIGGNATGSHDATDSFNKTWTETHENTEIHDSGNLDASTETHTSIDDHSHTDIASHNGIDLAVG